jgi:hypothetical protein
MAKKKKDRIPPPIKRPATAAKGPSTGDVVNTFAALVSMGKLVAEVAAAGVVELPKSVTDGIEKATACARKKMNFGQPQKPPVEAEKPKKKSKKKSD